MGDRVKEAIELFEKGFSCSQSVFTAYSDLFGLDKDIALKLSNGFGGGIARRQEICGAVTGAVMLIGLKEGKIIPSDTVAHEKTYEMINCFCQKFIEKNNSLNCSELLGCDLALASEKRLFATMCKGYVQDAAEIINNLLDE
ncbi:C_GCAxxG_C_C family probable redox protein [Natranaerovirga pectinivora]|uniref:C_GCAxxG_C_C family probable redox protein n=1 Tax=Natranaerovirga pectinivora TaxID=682400 RepID=A0A4R3MPD9_9FIRM|nr:C-GCAxxG-C-C family protein [Natranaerovirga pectinivora]TCT17167.1 C_GCAxxG_C_C family probable redox protein [Natranaerovirga pectinivora]